MVGMNGLAPPKSFSSSAARSASASAEDVVTAGGGGGRVVGALVGAVGMRWKMLDRTGLTGGCGVVV